MLNPVILKISYILPYGKIFLIIYEIVKSFDLNSIGKFRGNFVFSEKIIFLTSLKHCRPDQKSAPQKICGSACTLVNQLVCSKNDPWWCPDFFLSTPKLGKACKRPQN